MMKDISRIVIYGLISFIAIFCSDSGTQPIEKNYDQNSDQLSEVFNISVGSTYTYTIDTMNQSTSTYENIGTRSMTVQDVAKENENENFTCLEITNLLGEQITEKSNILITSNSVEIAFDTSGADKLIPDSLKSQISLELNDNLKLIEFPYLQDQPWSAYKGSVKFGTLGFNILSINGQFENKENLILSGLEDHVETSKFKYTLTLNIPDLSNPFLTKIQKYEVYIWLSSELGIVKMEGSALMINSISGSRFDIADSSKILRHTLAPLI